MFWVNLTDRNPSTRPPTHVNLKHNINSSLDELTLCAWVKGLSIQHNASIIHYGEGKDQNCDNDIAITYRTNKRGFFFYISSDHARVNFSLADGRPHHLCVTWKKSGLWNAFQDGRKVSAGSGLKTEQSIEANGWLVIGQNINRQTRSRKRTETGTGTGNGIGTGSSTNIRKRRGTSSYKCTDFKSNSLFIGSISQVYLWNASLDSKLVYLLYSNCTVPVIDRLLFRWNVTNVELNGSVLMQRFP